MKALDPVLKPETPTFVEGMGLQSNTATIILRITVGLHSSRQHILVESALVIPVSYFHHKLQSSVIITIWHAVF
jgi:hypothetical protein